MFEIARRRTFSHDVTVMTPVDGGHEKEKLQVTYNVLDVEVTDGFNLKTLQGTNDFLLAAVAKLDGLVDGEKKPVPYNDAVRDQLFRLPHVRQALASGYFDAVSKAATGN